MPIGCASYLKDFINYPTSVWTKVCSITFLENALYSCGVGNYPKITKNATYKKLALSART